MFLLCLLMVVASAAVDELSELKKLGCSAVDYLEDLTLIGEGHFKRAFKATYKGKFVCVKRPFVSWTVYNKYYHNRNERKENVSQTPVAAHLWESIKRDFWSEINNAENLASKSTVFPRVYAKCEKDGSAPAALHHLNDPHTHFSIVELARPFIPEVIQEHSWRERLQLAYDIVNGLVSLSQPNSTMVGCIVNANGWGISQSSGKAILIDADYHMRDYEGRLDEWKCDLSRDGSSEEWNSIPDIAKSRRAWEQALGLEKNMHGTERFTWSTFQRLPVSALKEMSMHRFDNLFGRHFGRGAYMSLHRDEIIGACPRLDHKWLVFSAAWGALVSLVPVELEHLLQIHRSTPIRQFIDRVRVRHPGDLDVMDDASATKAHVSAASLITRATSLRREDRPSSRELLQELRDLIELCDNTDDKVIVEVCEYHAPKDLKWKETWIRPARRSSGVVPFLKHQHLRGAARCYNGADCSKE